MQSTNAQFTAETSSDGIVERDFRVGEVPGVLFSPASGAGCAPLVLTAHSGGGHKRAPAILARAQRLVTEFGVHVAALDAPGHGDRPRTAADEQHVALLRAAQAAGRPIGPVVINIHRDLATRAVPEWQAALDYLQALPEIDPAGPVGFWGIMQGSGIGVPLVAAESRITAAVLGHIGHESLTEAAARITVPIEFQMQWNDEHITRDSGLALFDAFASTVKTLHANAGRHSDVPRFEHDSAARFLARHLTATPA